MEVRVDSALVAQRRSSNPSRTGSVPIAEWIDTARSIVLNGASDRPVIDAARSLLLQARNRRLNYFEEAQSTLQFVQSIPYSTDRASVGLEDYWRFPVETLADDTGDCECKAILAAALFQAMGLRSLLLLSTEEGHAAVAVEGAPDFPQHRYLDHDGRLYYFCETTSDPYGYTVGEVPPGVDAVARYPYRVVFEPTLT